MSEPFEQWRIVARCVKAIRGLLNKGSTCAAARAAGGEVAVQHFAAGIRDVRSGSFSTRPACVVFDRMSALTRKRPDCCAHAK
jgi:hypothetical protein